MAISVWPEKVSLAGSSVSSTCCELGFASFSITYSLAWAELTASATLTVNRLFKNISIPDFLLLERH